MVCFLTGMQDGYSKYSYYFCLWVAEEVAAAHYRQKHWPVRNEYEVEKWENAILNEKRLSILKLY